MDIIVDNVGVTYRGICVGKLKSAMIENKTVAIAEINDKKIAEEFKHLRKGEHKFKLTMVMSDDELWVEGSTDSYAPSDIKYRSLETLSFPAIIMFVVILCACIFAYSMLVLCWGW